MTNGRVLHLTPYNTAAHAHLLEQGYTFTHHPADFDDGDAENGPGYGGHCAFDLYESTDEHVVVDENGIADRQTIDAG